MKDLSVQVQGLQWPARLPGYDLLGPVNDRGKFRWYCKTYYYVGESGMEKLGFKCIKVGNQLQVIATGDIEDLSPSLSRVQHQRAIAKCIRKAKPF